MNHLDVIADSQKKIFHVANNALALGCASCSDRSVCGGLQVASPVIDCLDFCKCTDDTSRSQCQFVCKNNAYNFIARRREIRDFTLRIEKAPAIMEPSFPEIIPLIYNASTRTEILQAEAVAIPLKNFFHLKSKMRLSSREALAHRYKITPHTKIILSGVMQDPPLERYWSNLRDEGILEYLAVLRPDLVTSPNFTLFLDTPRWDNLYNMKRIAICWYEIAALGIPTALHVNARTDHDWVTWASFLKDHPEIKSIAFEFATGGRDRERAAWYARHMRALMELCGRPLRLIIRGQRALVKDICRSGTDVINIDSTPFIKTVHRQKLQLSKDKNHRTSWRSTFTLKGQPLDGLLQHNLNTASIS